MLETDGTPSFEGLLDLWSLIYASYVGSRSGLQEVLDATDGGEILHWRFDPTSTLMDFSLTRQGNHYYFALAGTCLPTQWVGNVVGAVAVAYKSPLTLVNGFWSLLWQQARAELLQYAPRPSSDLKLTVTGHSLGGAVGQLAANDLAEIYGPDNVELCAFAQPKAITAGYRGTQPSTYIRVCRYGDPVPYTPPQIAASLWTPFIDGGLLSVAGAIPWAVYGRGWRLQETGAIVPDDGEYVGGWLDLYRIGQLSFEAHRSDSWTELFERIEA